MYIVGYFNEDLMSVLYFVSPPSADTDGFPSFSTSPAAAKRYPEKWQAEKVTELLSGELNAKVYSYNVRDDGVYGVGGDT